MVPYIPFKWDSCSFWVNGWNCLEKVEGKFLVRMSHILTGVIVTWVHIFVKIHQMVLICVLLYVIIPQ